METSGDNQATPSAAADRPGWFARHRRLLAIVATCLVAFVYLAGVTDKWWPTSDSAEYLVLARSLAAGEGYLFNGEVCTDVTPGLPAILAAIELASGGRLWAANLFLALCGLGAIWLIFLALKLRSGELTAFAAAMCCAWSYAYYFNSHRILTDVPFALLLWGLLYFCLRAQAGRMWWLTAAMLLTAAALLVRGPGLIVIGPLTLGLLFDSPGDRRTPIARRLAISAAVLAASALTVLAMYLAARLAMGDKPLYVQSLEWLKRGYILLALRRAGEAFLALPMGLTESFTSQDSPAMLAVGGPALALMIVGGWAMWRRGRRMETITIILSIAGLGIVGSAASIRPRYLLPVVPMMFAMTAEGIRWTVEAIRSRSARAAGRQEVVVRGLAIFAAIIALCNLPRLSRHAFYYSYLSHTAGYYEKIRHGRYEEQVSLAADLRELCAHDARIAVPDEDVGIFHYLARRLTAPLSEFTSGRQDARQTAESLRSSRDVAVVVLNASREASDFDRAVAEALLASGEFAPVRQAERYAAYRRIAQGGA